MKIRLFGQRNILGAGTHFANFSDALKRIKSFEGEIEEFNLLDAAQVRTAIDTSNGADINIWLWQDDRITQFRGVNVVWAIFEFDELPGPYIAFLRNNAQVVWTPSRWGKEVLIANGVIGEAVDVVPEGVAAETFHPHLRARIDKSGQPFRYLILGKYEKRKSYGETLDAFEAAFGSSNSVELVVKGDYFLRHEEKKQALSELVASRNLANVKLLWGNWSPENLLGLYSACDAFVFPSKGEAWGLPLLEAAACGMPVISTFYSGQTEYLEHIGSSRLDVEFTLEEVDDAEMHRVWRSTTGDLGRWARPSVDSIAHCMRMVKESYPRYLSAARRNSLTLREGFGWSAAADKALFALHDRGLLGDRLKVSMT